MTLHARLAIAFQDAVLSEAEAVETFLSLIKT